MTQRFVDVPTRAVLAQRIIDSMSEIIPDIAPNESAVAWYWADLLALDAIERAQEFNGSAFENWIITATGQGLDELLRNYGIDASTLPAGTTDAQKRRLALDQFTSVTIGTAEHTARVARASNSLVGDVSAMRDPANNKVIVYLADANGQPLDATQRGISQTYLDRNDIHPIYFDFDVQAAITRQYTLTVTGTYAENTNDPTDQVRANAEATVPRLRKLNTTISEARLIQGLAVLDAERNLETVRLLPVINETRGGRLNSLPYPINRVVNVIPHITVGTINLTEEA